MAPLPNVGASGETNDKQGQHSAADVTVNGKAGGSWLVVALHARCALPSNTFI